MFEIGVAVSLGEGEPLRSKSRDFASGCISKRGVERNRLAAECGG